MITPTVTTMATTHTSRPRGSSASLCCVMGVLTAADEYCSRIARSRVHERTGAIPFRAYAPRVATAEMEKQTFRVAPEPHSVPRAREWVIALAEPFVAAARIADLRLVISEVITNAVRHGGEGDMVVAVTPKPGYLCVQVTDTGDGFA